MNKREYGYIYDTGAQGVVGSLANVLVAVIFALALHRSNVPGAVVVVATALYYPVTTYGILLITSGTIVRIIEIIQHERTQREINAYATRGPGFAPWKVAAHPEPDEDRQLGAPNYVPAQTHPNVQMEAAAWLMTLFHRDGTLREDKVLLNTRKETPGRLRCAAPSQDATDHLVSRHILRPLYLGDRKTGYALNMRYCERHEALQAVEGV